MTVRFHDALTPLMVPIEQVTPYPGNPRIGDTQVIADSITENGMYQPVVVQRSTGYVLAGNHRHAALLSLGEKSIPVVWVDVDDDRARRIALADNRTTDLATYDQHALLELLEGLDDLAGTGYVVEDLDDLQMLLSDPEDLDELAAKLGPTQADDDWVTVAAFRLPPELARAWQAAVDHHGGDVVDMVSALVAEPMADVA